MAGQGIGVAAPFRWMQQALALLRRQPRQLAGAAAVLVVVALLPSVLQLVLVAVMPGQAQAGWIQILGFVFSLLIYPPAVGGFYRVVHALETGRETAPGAVLEMFGDGMAMARMIIVNLLFVCLTLFVFSGLAWLLGGEDLLPFMQAMLQLKPGATELPPLPRGLLPLLLSVVLVGALLVSAKGFATAEAALGHRSPLPAALAGLATAGRNYGALLLFYVPLVALAFIAFMLVALVAVLLGALLAVISPVLAAIVVLPLSLLLVLAIYALLFTFFYYGWRELFDTPPPPAPSAPNEFAA